MRLRVNGQDHDVDVPEDMPLLWVLRDVLGLTGTKFGCGMAQCGACTVHVGERSRAVLRAAHRYAWASAPSPRSRDCPRAASHPGAAGLDRRGRVVQCGYCQPGQVMAAAALLKAKAKPTDADIDAALSANLCRCGTYQRIRAAVHRAAGQTGGRS